MASPTATSMFRNFTYQRSMAEVVEKANGKIAFLLKKIEERTERIRSLQKEYSITESDIIDLLSKQSSRNGYENAPMSYALSGMEGERVIGAGVVQNLLTEKNAISAEKESVAHLKTIARNLRPYKAVSSTGLTYEVDYVELSQVELDYLGF